VRQFAEGLEEILVVEEKRQVVEYQLKEELYNWRDDVRPRVIGKFDEKGEWAHRTASGCCRRGELTPAMIARVIAARIERGSVTLRAHRRRAWPSSKPRKRRWPNRTRAVARIPHFCSGCPHNTSTRVPEGSRALAGIGCHYMATWMDRNTADLHAHGRRGRAWVGQAPFTDTRTSSPTSATAPTSTRACWRSAQAVAAKVNITYKILYNDAVAMTGGQPVTAA
jgi:indolepyruvate ferredoxin oxidoreductase